MPSGDRRLDRVLEPDFMAGLDTLALPDLRDRRAQAEQEETDLSYLRRLAQGRLDILRAETARRRGETEGDLVDALPQILAEGERSPAHGMGRHVVVEPSRVDSQRRWIEALVADTDVTDLDNRSDEEVADAVARLEAAEATVSRTRKAVQQVMDTCSAEVTRRYRDGEADVADLLAAEGSPS